MIPLNPIAYVRFASRVAYHSWKQRSAAQIGLLSQIAEIARLLRLNHLEPYEYYEYEFHDGRLNWDQKTRFMSHHQASRFYTEVNSFVDRGALNKLIVHTLFERFGLPTPKLYGVFDKACGRTSSGESLRTLDDLHRFLNQATFSNFVVKPVSSQRGLGLKIINIHADGILEDVGAGNISVEQLYGELSSTRYNLNNWTSDIYLFEERARQHPFFDCFADSCTQCLRIITYISMAGEIEVLNTNIKIGTQGNVYDNTREEGISAGITPEGVFTAGVAVRNGRRLEFETHPVTGAPIKGVVVPGFQEAVDLAKRAQSLFPQVRCIGWDIAVTDKGPVIIEGNVTWSRHTQQYTRVGLISDAVRQELSRIV